MRIFNWKNALMFYAVPNVCTFFCSYIWVCSKKKPQNSFNELGSVFVTVTLTAADVFILFQWRIIKMYEYMEKNVYERCCDKLQSLKPWRMFTLLEL